MLSAGSTVGLILEMWKEAGSWNQLLLEHLLIVSPKALNPKENFQTS